VQGGTKQLDVTHRQPDRVEPAVNNVLPVVICNPFVPMLFQPLLGVLAVSDIKLRGILGESVSTTRLPR
jgi:hypothetical protein